MPRRQNWLPRCPAAVLDPTSGKVGFNVVVGGYLSFKRCIESIPLDTFVPYEDVVAFAEAFLIVSGTQGRMLLTTTGLLRLCTPCSCSPASLASVKIPSASPLPAPNPPAEACLLPTPPL